MITWAGSFVCSSFKRELFEGVHDFRSDIFKMALYGNDAILTPSTSTYTVDGELLPLQGYTAGGNQVVVLPPVLAGLVAYIDMENVSWPDASFTARGGLLYNSSKTGWPAVFVLDFEVDRIPNAGVFSVRFPVGDAKSAILRIP